MDDPAPPEDAPTSVVPPPAGLLRWSRLAWLPILGLLAGIIVARVAGLSETYRNYDLRLVLSITFYTVVALATLYLFGRSFLGSGAPSLLLLECGVLLWSLAGTLGDLFDQGDQNANVTIFNVGILLAGLCHLAGAVLTRRPAPAVRARLRWLATGGAICLAVLGLLTWAARAHWLPVFFIPGKGGTLLRTIVLATAIAAFLFSAALLGTGRRGAERAFRSWYVPALLALVVGLLGIMIQRELWTVLNWLSRSAQWLGGFYLLVAAMASVRRTGAWQISLDAVTWNQRIALLDEQWLRVLTPERTLALSAAWRYGVAVVVVAAATALRWALIPWLDTMVPYNVAFLVTILVVVSLGFGPGLLTVLLGDLAVEVFVLGVDPTRFGSEDLVRLGVSAIIGVFLCVVLHALRVAQRKARQGQERLAAFAAATFEGIVETRGGRILDCNEQFARMFGCAVEELKGTAVADLIAPEDRERVLANIQANRESITEHVMIRKDGTRLIVEAHGRSTSLGARQTVVRDITERKRAEEALEKARGVLAEGQKIAHVGTFEFVAETGSTVWSEEEYRIYGLDPAGPSPAYDDMLARCIHPDDAALLDRNFTVAMQSLGVYELEHRIVRPDGSVRWVYDQAHPYFDTDGRLVRYVGTTLDITERRRADEDVRLSRDHLRLAQQAAHAGSWEWDLRTNENFWSEELWELYGLEPHGCRPSYEAWLETIHPDDRETAARAVQAAASAGTDLVAEWRIRPTDGRERWVMSRGRPILDAGGRVIRYLGIVIDITRLKEAEAQLRRLNETLEARVAEQTAEIRRGYEVVRTERQRLFDVLETLPAMICLMTPEHQVTFANRSFRDQFGESHGRKCYEYCFGKTQPCEFCESFNVLKTGRPHHWEVTCSDGTILDAHDFPFPDADGTPLILEMDIDITGWRNAESALKRANEALGQRAGQLQALAAELVQTEQRERKRLAKVIHDHLQQLLVGAKFGVAALRSDARTVTQQESLTQLGDVLDEAIRSSRSLTADLSPPILHEQGLTPGLEWLARRMLQKHNLTVEVETGVRVAFEAEQLRVFVFEAVRELLFNIVKHAHTDRARVSVRRKDDDQVEVSVRDDGTGFDAAAFDGGASATGGFGLFSIRERLRFLGGQMEVESRPGHGSRVTLAVPMRLAETPLDVPPPSAAVLAPAPRRGPSFTRGKGIRVLLADDHPIVRHGTARLLQDCPDIEVVGEAADGREAVELARRLTPDVILMDVSLPHLSGIEATRQILRELPHARVIGLSMHEEADMAAGMREAGAAAYLTKGGPTDDLLAAIRAARPPAD